MARMGDFRNKIKSLIHRYNGWLTLISLENQDACESDYAKTDGKTDQVSFFVIANNFVKRPPSLVVQFLVSPWTFVGTRIGRLFWKWPLNSDHNNWASSIWRSFSLLGVWRLLLSDRRIGEICSHASSWRYQWYPIHKNLNARFYLSLITNNAAIITCHL